MPRLCQRRDGGLYIRGLAGQRWCTWQVTSAGVAALRQRGLEPGDSITHVELSALLHSSPPQAVTSGTGLGDETAALAWVKPLASRLTKWAEAGVSGTADAAVSGADDRRQCFSPGFFHFLATVSPTGQLADLADSGPVAFRDPVDLNGLAADPLFHHLYATGADDVVWRLAREVGIVAAHRRATPCRPYEWPPTSLRAWLFDRLADKDLTPTRPGRRTAPGPRLEWQVGSQQVVVILPGRSVPAETSRLSWAVGDRPVRHLTVTADGRVGTVESDPLPAATGYLVTLTGIGGISHGRWRLSLPGDGPVVLFHPNGEAVDPDGPDPLPAGEYLCLIRAGEAAPLPGVSLGEPVDYPPVGWPGWAGFWVDVAPGAEVPGYQVSVTPPALTWSLPDPAAGAVRWAEADPVFLGPWPVIECSGVDGFHGAVVEVASDAPDEVEPIAVVADKDVHVTTAEGTPGLDLNVVAGLRGRFGRLTLRLRPVKPSATAPTPLRLVRLPDLAATTVADSPATTAIRLAASGPLDLVAGSGTELVPSANGVTLRVTDPVASPTVSAQSRTGGWEVRARVGVCRGRRESPDGAGDWQPLPLAGIEIGGIRPNDTLRLEFHQPPVTENGELVCRQVGGAELFVGRPAGTDGTAFVVPLTRWRDGFSRWASGRIEVRGTAGWIEVATLIGLADPTKPSPLQPWQVLRDELTAAIAEGDEATARSLVDQALDHCRDPRVGAVATDLLTAAAGRAAIVFGDHGPVAPALAALGRRPDLPDATSAATVLSVRAVPLSGWSESKVQRWIGANPIAEAEAWYRYTRSARGPAPGPWQSCGELCGRVILADGESPHRWDAHLLRAVAALVLDEPLTDDPPTDLPPRHRQWVMAARTAVRFLRAPWRGSSPGAVAAPLPASPPPVLVADDVALLRVLHGLAAGGGFQPADWQHVARLPDHAMTALPLLRARVARYTGQPAWAAEYTAAAVAFQKDDRRELLELALIQQ